MHRHEVPSDREKNACPSASSSTLRESFEKSGWSRNEMPFMAPGSMHEATAMATSSTKSSGMSSLDTFSMPLRTPCITTMCVITMKAMVQSVGFSASELNDLKYSATYSGSPASCPAIEA